MTRAFAPASLDEALRVLADRGLDARPVAGCTDLLVRGQELPVLPPAIVDLTRLTELRGIEHSAESTVIGAATPFRAIERDPELRARFPILAEAAETIGGVQIRNRATLGGNIANASPVGDSLPVLLALNAELELVSSDGTRRVPYASMHTGYRETALRPGELIARVHLPRPAPDSFQRFTKVGTRAAQAISKVVVAFVARLDADSLRDVRLAAGAVADRPIRLTVVERLLEGAPPDAALAERAGELARSTVSPIDDARSTALYRGHVLGRVVRRGVLEAAAGRA